MDYFIFYVRVAFMFLLWFMTPIGPILLLTVITVYVLIRLVNDESIYSIRFVNDESIYSIMIQTKIKKSRWKRFKRKISKCISKPRRGGSRRTFLKRSY